MEITHYTGGKIKMADQKFKYKEFQYDDFEQNPYQESDTVKQAQAALNTHLAQKPGAYQSQWQTQLNDTMDKILNREKFSYDFNGDALYQQYKDKYIQQGKMASADVMGQAAAMTGGYGNSYAATVGNQAYQASLQNLNDIIPELYQMALDRYNQEGQDLLNQYGILGDRENTDYGRYRDTVSDWGNERNYLTGRYDSERNYDYGKYTDDRNFNYGKYSDDKNFAYGKYSDDKSYAYNEHRNAIADAQWQKEFDEAMRQHNESIALQKQKYVADTPIEEETADNYAAWDHGDWESYFATIRNTKSKSAAEEELSRMNKAGLIPKNYVAAASIGARGSLGH
jgi:hypothetical protein